MADFLGLLSKLFSKEPLERIMFIIILFAVGLVITPENIHAYVERKIGFPYSYQVFMFALAFVIGVNAQRICISLKNKLSSHMALRKKFSILKEINEVIDSLNEKQIYLIKSHISTNQKHIYASKGDKDIAELVEYGVLHPSTFQDMRNPLAQASLSFDDDYWDVLMYRWNGYTGVFDPTD